ncbi:asparaginase domain-containing protein [Sulfurospirillum arcachonense]|uniref:asparaginase domain-containing protein n=1 Tax=Sulfurospirillum arcachonense TaxID=57666 RepID=UPI00046A8E03|nr:asparaginase domain-containing protein [Sulfurospirillum arcachonense]
MKDILIINTGGTFNKRYNPLKGELEVPVDSLAVDSILKYFYNLSYELQNVIHKDSLEMLDSDRQEMAELIQKSPQKKILIIHGTDTKDKTAKYLENIISDKSIVLTGAMVPLSIDTVEANANFSMALGYLLNEPKNGVYIAMHGLVEKHDTVFKNREVGIFQKVTCKE